MLALDVALSESEREAQRLSPKCAVCGHAKSLHNTLGYCRSTSKGKGDCTCDMTPGSVW